MSRKKEKVKLFERIIIEDALNAESIFEKERQRFKFNLICTAIAAIATLIIQVGQTAVGDYLFFGIFEWIAFAVYVVGVIAAIASGPINSLKLIWKLGTFGYWIIPFWIVDLVGFVAGLAIGLILLIMTPVVTALYNLYQSYLNMKEAEKYLTVSKINNAYYEC